MVFNKSLLICRLHKRPYGRINMYDVVVTFKTKPVRGLTFLKLGYLSLEPKNKVFFLNFEKLAFCLNNGVKLGDSVRKYISTFAGF